MIYENRGKGPWGENPWDDHPKPPPPSQEDEFDAFIRKSRKKLKGIFPGNTGDRKGNNPLDKRLPILIGIIAFFLWLFSGVYIVDATEEAVVMRFGQYVRTEKPGLHYKLPTPIEKVIKVLVTTRYKEEIGFNPSTASQRSSHSDTSREILMLTGDENIIDINFEVQWQINDTRKFLFNVYDPIQTVRDAAESAMREIIGTTLISKILSEGRHSVQTQTRDVLQGILDSYDAGIKIETINMRGVPPSQVDEAFKDVQAAKINKEEAINKAIAYKNEMVPKSRGDAARLIQEAEAYKEQIVAQSIGEASRFNAIYSKYKNAKQVTKDRIYLETMEEILKGTDKIVLDTKAARGTVPYLPLPSLQKTEKGTPQ